LQHGIGTVTGNPNAGKKNCINYCKACLQLSGVQNGHALLEKKGTAKAEEKDDKNMAYYLIDYENVRIHGLDGLSTLSEHDRVCIFYSENADSLTFDLHFILNEAKAKISYQKVEIGTKNALDFQLSSYLGYLIYKHRDDKNTEYFIVTADGGFSVLVNYWNKEGVIVKIVIDCTGRDENAEKEKLYADIENLIQDRADVPVTAEIIQRCRSKQEVHNALIKELKDSEKAGSIYRAIKPLLADKQGRV
jgi:hypothetical protein